MSNINKAISTSDEQLFTELTPEQASLLEGGALLFLLQSVEAIKTDADLVGKDEAYMRVNGKKIWSSKMSAGDRKNLNEAVVFDDIATIRLYDKDLFDDDYMGGFNVTAPTNGKKVRRVSGSGSKYDIGYEVIQLG